MIGEIVYGPGNRHGQPGLRSLEANAEDSSKQI